MSANSSISRVTGFVFIIIVPGVLTDGVLFSWLLRYLTVWWKCILKITCKKKLRPSGDSVFLQRRCWFASVRHLRAISDQSFLCQSTTSKFPE